MFAKEAIVLLPEEFYFSHCGEIQTKVALNRVLNKIRDMGITIHTMNLFQNLDLIDGEKEVFNVFNQCDNFIMNDQGYMIKEGTTTNKVLDDIKNKSVKRYPYDPKVNHLEGMFYAAKKRCLKTATAFTKEYKCIIDFQAVKERLITISEKTIKNDCLYIKFDAGNMQLSFNFGEQKLSAFDVFKEKSNSPLRW